MRSFLILTLSFVLSSSVVVADETETGRKLLRSDPDTKCSETYRKDPSKDVCLSTDDHFLRPCEFCTTKDGGIYCYNADQARWAKFFGGTCETRPISVN